jgi:hypothetical protein
MKKQGHTIYLSFIVMALLLTTCTNDYNPFKEYSNAQVYVQPQLSSIKNNDTVSIFSTETLAIDANVREKIEQFTLHSRSNRYFADTTVFSPIKIETYRFYISFYDTGVQTISLSVKRTNGEIFRIDTLLLVYVRSLLKQKDLKTSLGTPCDLATASVKDPVWYIWSFGTYRGKEKLFSSQFPENIDQQIFGVGVDTTLTGRLWVTDNTRRFKSPAATFSYLFTDTIGPAIAITSNGIIRNDTIITGENNYLFSFTARDISGEEISSVSIPNQQLISSDGIEYSTTLTGMNTFTRTSPRRVILSAWDKQGDTTRNTYYLYYDASAPLAEKIRLRFISPATPAVQTQNSLLPVIIEAENISENTIDIRVSLSSDLIAKVKTIPPNTNLITEWSIALPIGQSNVRITAHSGNVQYKDTSISVTRLDILSDTTKPKIPLIYIDSQTIRPPLQLYATTQKKMATLRIFAFDEESGIAEVRINDSIITTQTSSGYIWTYEALPLQHPYSTILVTVTDKANNSESALISVTSNNPPRIIEPIEFPKALMVGKLFKDTIILQDDDNDTVKLRAHPKVNLTSIGFNKWEISYTPVLEDAGVTTIPFSLSDPYDNEILFPWTFLIAKDKTAYVNITTPTDSIQRVLQAGADSIRQPISVVSGFPPFTYSARFTQGNKLNFLKKSSNRSEFLKWKPSVGDTGIYQMIVTVCDSAGVCDTIVPYPTITVVQKNQYACSLSISPNEHLIESALDMTTAVLPETLFFAINDRDDPRTESFKVSVILNNITTAPTLFLTNHFQVIIEPSKIKIFDTLTVIIEDQTKTKDTIQIPIRYTAPPPELNSSIFLWNKADSNTILLTRGQELAVKEWISLANNELTGISTFVTNGYLDSAAMPLLIRLNATTPAHLRFYRHRQSNLLENDLNDRRGQWPSRPFTAFFVAKLDSFNTDSCYTLLSSSSSYNASLALGVGTGGKAAAFISNAAGIVSYNSNLSVTPGTWHVFTFISSGITGTSPPVFTVRVDGIADSSIAMNAASAGPYLMIGATAKHTAQNAWNGGIAEILTYSKALTEKELSDIERYLKSKHRY